MSGRREPMVGGEAGAPEIEGMGHSTEVVGSISGSFGIETHDRPYQRPWSGPACDEEKGGCGGTKTRKTNSGKDKEERPLTKRQCQDCGRRFTTIEVEVPAKFSEVDVEHRRRQREAKRRKNGWQASTRDHGHKPKSITVEVRVR